MYNINLEKNEIVDIYFKPKSDFKVKECEGILLERDDNYTHSFYLDYEKLYDSKGAKSSLDVQADPIRLKLNNIYSFLDMYLNDPHSNHMKAFKRKCWSLTNSKIKSYNNLFAYIEEQKKEYKKNDPTNVINNIFSIETKYICRYFQQKKLKNWSPSLFELQKWKVRLIDRSDKFFIECNAYRYVSRLIAINPNNSDIVNMTSSSINYTRYV